MTAQGEGVQNTTMHAETNITGSPCPARQSWARDPGVTAPALGKQSTTHEPCPGCERLPTSEGQRSERLPARERIAYRACPALLLLSERVK